MYVFPHSNQEIFNIKRMKSLVIFTQLALTLSNINFGVQALPVDGTPRSSSFLQHIQSIHEPQFAPVSSVEDILHALIQNRQGFNTPVQSSWVVMQHETLISTPKLSLVTDIVRLVEEEATTIDNICQFIETAESSIPVRIANKLCIDSYKTFVSLLSHINKLEQSNPFTAHSLNGIVNTMYSQLRDVSNQYVFNKPPVDIDVKIPDNNLPDKFPAVDYNQVAPSRLWKRDSSVTFEIIDNILNTVENTILSISSLSTSKKSIAPIVEECFQAIQSIVGSYQQLCESDPTGSSSIQEKMQTVLSKLDSLSKDAGLSKELLKRKNNLVADNASYINKTLDKVQTVISNMSFHSKSQSNESLIQSLQSTINRITQQWKQLCNSDSTACSSIEPKLQSIINQLKSLDDNSYQSVTNSKRSRIISNGVSQEISYSIAKV